MELFNFQPLSAQMLNMLSFIVNITIKSTIILMVAYIFAKLMRNYSSSARHLLCSLALAGILLLPVLSIILPSWNVSLFPDFLSGIKADQRHPLYRLPKDLKLQWLPQEIKQSRLRQIIKVRKT